MKTEKKKKVLDKNEIQIYLGKFFGIYCVSEKMKLDGNHVCTNFHFVFVYAYSKKFNNFIISL